MTKSVIKAQTEPSPMDVANAIIQKYFSQFRDGEQPGSKLFRDNDPKQIELRNIDSFLKGLLTNTELLRFLKDVDKHVTLIDKVQEDCSDGYTVLLGPEPVITIMRYYTVGNTCEGRFAEYALQQIYLDTEDQPSRYDQRCNFKLLVSDRHFRLYNEFFIQPSGLALVCVDSDLTTKQYPDRTYQGNFLAAKYRTLFRGQTPDKMAAKLAQGLEKITRELS